MSCALSTELPRGDSTGSKEATLRGVEQQYKTSNQTHEGLNPILWTRKLKLIRGGNLTKATHKKCQITDLNSELIPEPVMSLHKFCIRGFLDFLMSLKSKPKELDNQSKMQRLLPFLSLYTKEPRQLVHCTPKPLFTPGPVNTITALLQPFPEVSAPRVPCHSSHNTTEQRLAALYPGHASCLI